MTWMVTGGAGYIGAHVTRALKAAGVDAVVFDSLVTGRREFVPDGIPLVVGDICDTVAVETALREHAVVGVMHIAGFKYAGVSVQEPLRAYRDNVTGTASLLTAMRAVGVDRMVFSSSASVYGTPDVEVVTEDAALHPESPYGETKLIGEWLLRDQARADDAFRYTCLRYFNVVGSGEGGVYDTSPHNLFPIVFEMLLDGRTPRINGDDYPTPDGTCVRDYIHVADLADAHVAAAAALDAGTPLQHAYNLGSGSGMSVREIMSAIATATGQAFDPEIAPRRPGDPARILATGELAARDLGWQNRYGVEEMAASGWKARRAAR